MKTLTVGKLAKSANVNIETIRYYQRRGLIQEPPRSGSGYRQYTEGDIVRVKFIKRAQAIGFTLKEIEELLSLKIEPGVTCKDVKDRIDAKISDIENKILVLEQIKKTLLRMGDKCTGQGPIGKCPFLEELESNTSD